jgi:hypothetical protein
MMQQKMATDFDPNIVLQELVAQGIPEEEAMAMIQGM